MGEAHRRTHRAEELQALHHRQPAAGAEAVDGLALHVFHGEVGQAVRRGTAVEQLGDVGVVEGGQDLALGAEAADQLLAVGLRTQQLEGHLLLELVVRAGGQVYRAHAAASQQVLDPIVTDAPAHLGIPRSLLHGNGGWIGGQGLAVRGPVQGPGGTGVSGRDQVLYLPAQKGIAGAGLVEKDLALGRSQLAAGCRQALHPLLPLVLHEAHLQTRLGYLRQGLLTTQVVF